MKTSVAYSLPGATKLGASLAGSSNRRLGAETAETKGLLENNLLMQRIQEIAGKSELERVKADRLKGLEGSLEEYGASRSGTTLPEFRAYRQAQRTGEKPAIVYPNPVERDDEGNVLPTARRELEFSPEQSTALGRALAEVTAGLSATGEFQPQALPSVSEHAAKARGEEIRNPILESIAKALQGGDDEGIRRGQAALGHDVLKPEPETAYSRMLKAAGVEPGTPEFQTALRKYLEKLATHPPGVNIENYSQTPHLGTNPTTGELDQFVLDKQGNKQWLGVGPAIADPIKRLIEEAIKKRGGGTSMPKAVKTISSAKEFNDLPAGATYIDARDGQQKVKAGATPGR